MDETQQGQATPASATPQVQGEPATSPSATGLSAEVIQKYGAEPSATPSATPQAQGDGQGQVQQNTAQPDPARYFQAEADRQRAENLRLQQQMTSLMQQNQQFLQTQQAAQANRNPYDPNTQGTDWWKFEMQSAAKQAAQEAASEAEKRSQRQLETLVTTAYENSWAQAHPNVDVNMVKAFADQNFLGGPNRLDNAFRLMTIPQTVNQVAQATAQQALNQFRQPTNAGAVPLRSSGQPSPQTPQLSFAKLAEDFQNTNGAVYNTWPKDIQAAFDKEWSYREGLHTRG